MTAKKAAAKPAARKNVPPTGKPFKKGDARINRTTPGPGRPPDAFREEMRALASRDAHLERLREILGGRIPVTINGETTMIPVDSDTYLKALAFATDRGYGKAQQHVDVTTNGRSIADILRKGRERAAKVAADR